jgi:DNA-directed RNA polymerase subunit K/omega
MIIPLDKLISFDENRYVMTRVAMATVDRIESLTEDMVEGEQWKIVPNVLRLMMNGAIKFEMKPE